MSVFLFYEIASVMGGENVYVFVYCCILPHSIVVDTGWELIKYLLNE